jgi:hypothetical protein
MLQAFARPAFVLGEIRIPSNDLYSRVKLGVVATLKALNLSSPGIGGVYSQPDVDTDSTNISFPCIVCVYTGLTEEVLGGDSELRQYNWPVGLMVLDNIGKGVLGNESMYTGWRKQITDAFHQQKLMNAGQAVAGVANCIVMPRLIFDVRLPQFQRVQSSLLIKVEAWESRYIVGQ